MKPIFLVHNFLWTEVAFLFEDGHLEHVLWVSPGKTSRVGLGFVRGWDPSFVPVGGCICTQPGDAKNPQGFPSSITIFLKNEKENITRIRRGFENGGEPHMSPPFIQGELENGTYWRPLLDAFGNYKGFDRSGFDDTHAWTTCSPTGEFTGVEGPTKDGVGIHIQKFRRRIRSGERTDLVESLGKRKYLFPDDLDIEPNQDQVVDIHPTLGHEVALRRGLENGLFRWTVLRLPQGKKRIMEVVAEWNVPKRPAPPYIWTRLGCRSSMLQRSRGEKMWFEMWDGTTVFSEYIGDHDPG